MTEHQPEALAVPPSGSPESLEIACRTLASMVARNHLVLQAAAIEMRQNGPHAGMQWVLNSVPDQWGDEATAWDGKESAQAWFDRVDAAWRAAEADAARSRAESPATNPAEPGAATTTAAEALPVAAALAGAKAKLVTIGALCREPYEVCGTTGADLVSASDILAIIGTGEEAHRG